MPRGRPNSLPEPWCSLARRLGGVGRLANALETVPGTVWRWAHGERVPSRSTWILIQEAFEKAGLPVPERGTPLLKPRNDLQRCLNELRAGLREYQALKTAGGDGLLVQLGMADALARMEAAGIAMERTVYAAVLKLVVSGEEAQQDCQALVQFLGGPLEAFLASALLVDADSGSVFRSLKKRWQNALNALLSSTQRRLERRVDTEKHWRNPWQTR